MKITVEPTNDRDYRAYIDSLGGKAEVAEITDNSLTDEETLEELVMNHPNLIGENDRLHVTIDKFTFEDVHYSSRRHEEVYTADGRYGTSEFLIEIDKIDQRNEAVRLSPVPILSEVRQSTDAPILRVFRLNLLLKGILKQSDKYIPIERAFETTTSEESNTQIYQSCPGCGTDLSEYDTLNFCPECGTEQ
jgi:hypothetical protein